MMAAAPSPVMYAITPATPFSPATSSGSSRIYIIGTILEKRESRHVEYKNTSLSQLEAHVRRYGSAFLNSSGGILCMGVSDDGRVAGIRLRRYSQSWEDIRRRIRQEFEKFTPPVQQDLYEINFIPCNKKEFYILEIAVRAGDPYEIYSDGADKMYYKRDGSVEGPLWPYKIREIVSAKYRKKLEDQRSLQ